LSPTGTTIYFLISRLTAPPPHPVKLATKLRQAGGDGLLISGSDTVENFFPQPVKFFSLGLPRAALGMLTADPEAAIMKLIPKENEALRLLKGYLSVLDGQMVAFAKPALAHECAGHVLDLTALALGATKDGAELARERGLRAARLCAIKIDIANNLNRPNLSVTDVAASHGVSPRYVQTLFEAEGSTFSEFVLSQRLALVLRRLVDRRFADRTIGDIVREAGLAGSSYFSRVFRQRYGATPSEVRRAALDAGNEPQ